MRSSIPISAALADANLLGAALGDIASWQVWLAILKAAFAEPMSDDERARFALVAGDRAPPVTACSRNLGGTNWKAFREISHGRCRGVHIAALTDHSKRLAPGEIGTVAVIAASTASNLRRCSVTCAAS